jgi:hypothetical protein
MNNRAGILYTQLTVLEKRVEFLEKNTESALDYFLKLPEGKQTAAAEQRIIVKLWNLDALQDQMDAIVAELKENGWWASKIAGDAKYIYRRPEVKPKPKPPKEPRKPHKVYPVRSPREPKPNKRKTDREIVAARKAREAAKAAKAAKGPKPKPEPKPKVVRVPKSKQLQKAERGILDAVLDRNKVDGVFERQRLKDLEWIAEAEADLIKYADTPTAENGHQKRSRARVKLAAATERVNTIEERKEARYAELDKRQAKYEAEVRLLIANSSH